MEKNMGSVDRFIRFVVAISLIGLFTTGTLTGTWGIAVLVLAGVFLLTSLVRVCPLYLPFGIRTNRSEKHVK